MDQGEPLSEGAKIKSIMKFIEENKKYAKG